MLIRHLYFEKLPAGLTYCKLLLLFLICVLFLCFYVYAAAQDAQKAQTPQAATAPVAPEPTPAIAEEANPAGQGNVTLDFKEADIANVLKIISLKSGVNIVTTPDVSGNV